MRINGPDFGTRKNLCQLWGRGGAPLGQSGVLFYINNYINIKKKTLQLLKRMGLFVERPKKQCI
jgi:hypothetical protein